MEGGGGEGEGCVISLMFYCMGEEEGLKPLRSICGCAPCRYIAHWHIPAEHNTAWKQGILSNEKENLTKQKWIKQKEKERRIIKVMISPNYILLCYRFILQEQVENTSYKNTNVLPNFKPPNLTFSSLKYLNFCIYLTWKGEKNKKNDRRQNQTVGKKAEERTTVQDNKE